ncbi:hypothetical protein ECC02_005484 [Trypanosoma cruzi]|uniref:Receptor-type adenylate cyclase GRESAG 4.1/3 periplasmic binding protein-like domain-containing protein n=1 Tax=Trypanosoma cruzi TaxID=5693 RepID=A0A7J6Y492_TRYCR|nr:hypothetical protein ECC02_005484 [Trypanosoma cruzi]
MGGGVAARATCLCGGAVPFVALLLLFDPQVAVSKPFACETSVKVFMLSVTGLPIDQKLVDSLEAGLEAALWSRNFTVADAVYVEIIRKVSTMQTSGAVIGKALNESSYILLVAGAIGDTMFANSLTVTMRHGLVLFAPFTGSSLVRGWKPKFYFLRADPAAELLALLCYALAHLRVRRLGFMYMEGEYFGGIEYELAERSMSGMGYELSGVFSVEGSVTGGAKKEVFDAAWEAFADTQPQAVIVFGSPTNDAVKFVMRMLAGKRTSGAYLLGSSVLQDLVLRVWRAAVAGGVEFVTGQVITTGTNPLAKDTQCEAIRRFQELMRVYLEKSGQKYYADKDSFFIHDDEGDMMVAGWISGEVLSQALGGREWVRDRTSFLASLYKQRR